MPDDLIIIAASARAAAQSAIRAGYRPWCVDLYADRDLRAIAPVKRCPAERWPQGVIELLADPPVAPDAPVLWAGAMENHLDVVREVERVRPSFGSDADAMAAARDLSALEAACEEAQAQLEAHHDPAWRPPYVWGPGVPLCWRAEPYVRWAHRKGLLREPCIIKPYRSAGGRGIRPWRPDERVSKDEYVQELIEGVPISGVFRADAAAGELLVVTGQIIGDPAFGAHPYTYVGNIAGIDVPAVVRAQLRAIGEAMAGRAGMRGVFGIDAVVSPDHATVAILEINPRYVASVEVLERATGIAALGGTHARLAATRRGALPAGNATSAGSAPLRVAAKRSSVDTTTPGAVLGKAIIYAEHDCTVPDLYDLFPPDEVADVPDTGASFRTGQPICTVFARGRDRDECLARLREMAGRVYTQVLHE